jgi:hypothetical protein
MSLDYELCMPLICCRFFVKTARTCGHGDSRALHKIVMDQDVLSSLATSSRFSLEATIGAANHIFG